MTLEINQNLNGTFLALLRSVRFLISSLFVDATNLALDEGVLNVVSDIPGVLIFERTGVDDFICVVRSGVFLVAEPGWYKFWNEIEFIRCDPIWWLQSYFVSYRAFWYIRYYLPTLCKMYSIWHRDPGIKLQVEVSTNKRRKKLEINFPINIEMM